MLVLSRLPDQAVNIHLEDGRIVRVKYLRSRSGRISLGFEADPSITIARDEIDFECRQPIIIETPGEPS